MTKNNIILGVLGLLLIAAALYLLFGKGENADVIISEESPTSVAEQTFLNLTAQINPIEFNSNILSDPRFVSLQDLKTAIIPETSGRPDPFAPLSGVSAP